jgi:hypothetical protein
MSWQHRTLLATISAIMSGTVPHYATTRADNTRDVLPRSQAGSPGEKVSCWPAPEVSVNLNIIVATSG